MMRSAPPCDVRACDGEAAVTVSDRDLCGSCAVLVARVTHGRSVEA